MAILNNEEKEERIFIDPLAKDLEAGEAMELDAEADAYAQPVPPAAGRYNLHVTEAKDCYEMDKTDAGDVFYKANLECKIIDAADLDANGTMVFARVSTFVGRGRGISTMAYVLLKLGYPKEKLAGPISHKDLMVKFHKWLIKADQVAKDCLLDWQGYSKAQNAVIFNKMSDFPKDKEGNYQHIVEYRKAGQPSETIVARLKLKDWGPSASSGTSAKTASAAPVKVVKKVAAPVVDEDDDAAPTPMSNAKVTGKAKASAPSKSEVEALLDGDDD